jgi:hypothetical protein
MSGTRSASGLQCSHGSDLDTKIPRPKMPKSALPPELRKAMGLKPRSENDENEGTIWTAGSGVLAPTGSAPDGKFLKRGSGCAMSQRASALAQREMVCRSRATVLKARVIDDKGNALVVNRSDEPVNRKRKSSKGAEDMKNICSSRRQN